MDAELWHSWCTTPMVEEPPALSLYQWKHLASDDREAHTDCLDKWLRQTYLDTAEWRAVSSTITKLVTNNSRERLGTKDIIVLTGPNVIGKSTLMMNWGREQYNLWTHGAAVDRRGRPVIRLNEYCEADLSPIVWIDLRDLSRNSTIDRKLLNFHGVPPAGNNDALSIAVDNAFKRHRTLATIVDDTHLAWLDSKLGRQVLDHIKYLNTQLGQIGATLILVGANLQDTELVHDPQIRGRLKLLTLYPYYVDDAAHQAVWQRVVKQIEDRVLPVLPAGKTGMLFMQLAGELWYRSNGFPGHLVELVVEATLIATRDGTHRITRKHLDAIQLSEGAEDKLATHVAKRASSSDPAGVKPAQNKRNLRGEGIVARTS